MKNKKLLKAMSFVDEKYVTEADPRKKSARRFRSLYLAAAVAAILSISMVIGAGAWLLVPYNTDPPEVSKYADSEYYELIKKLNTVTYQKPRYDNNLDMIFGNLTNMFGAKAEAGGWESVFPIAIAFGIAGAVTIALMWNAPANGYEKLNKIIAEMEDED